MAVSAPEQFIFEGDYPSPDPKFGYGELPVVTSPEWTPDMVREALISCDAGPMQLAADLVEAMLIDDRISGVLDTRVLSMLGLPQIWEGDQDVLASLRGDNEGDGDWWKLFPESELSKLAKWGLMLGVGLGELVMADDLDKSGREVPRLKVWHPRWLRYQYTMRKWFVTTRTGQVEVTPGDGHWVLFTPYGAHRPWAYGHWRTLQFPWLVKSFAIRDWSRHNEMHGSPLRIGETPDGATQEMRENFQADLKALGRDAALILPPGYKTSFLEASAKTWTTFQAAIQWADHAAEVSLVGQIVSTEGSSGFSDGEMHERTRHELLSYTAEVLATCLHNQVITPWTHINFDGAQPPWVTWDVMPAEDRQLKAQTMLQLGQAIQALNIAAEPAGISVNAKEMFQRFDIPFVDQPIPPPPAPMPAPAATPELPQ